MENEREKTVLPAYVHSFAKKKEEEYIKVTKDLLRILALFNFLTQIVSDFSLTEVSLIIPQLNVTEGSKL